MDRHPDRQTDEQMHITARQRDRCGQRGMMREEWDRWKDVDRWRQQVGRILEHLALSLNQHSKLTAISVGFINMERHKSIQAHTNTHVSIHIHTH